MCGITGLIYTNNAPVSIVLQKMTDSIAHRGPDGEGHWIEGNVGIGHRRLAVIDLSPAGSNRLSLRIIVMYLVTMVRFIIFANCVVS